MAEIDIYPDEKQWLRAAAALFIEQAETSIAERDCFSVALAGGNTPAPLYSALAQPEYCERVNWAKVHLFWGDERHVLPDDPDSNYRLVRMAFLEKVSLPEENIHRVRTEMEVRLAAFNYEEDLRKFFKGEWPRFDLVLLGMGEDGHTASLFPHSAALNEESRWFVSNYAPEKKTWRLTLTRNAINAARLVVVLVRGASKAERLKAVLTGPKDPWDMPVQMVAPVDGKLIWLLDRAAASQLPPK